MHNNIIMAKVNRLTLICEYMTGSRARNIFYAGVTDRYV